jgi:hypothetical protein
MSHSVEPKPPEKPGRKQTPRIPSNILYDRVVPIALIVMAAVLVVVVIVAVLGLIGALQPL